MVGYCVSPPLLDAVSIAHSAHTTRPLCLLSPTLSALVNKVASKITFLLLPSLGSNHVYTELFVLGSVRNGLYIEKHIYAYLSGWASPRFI